jgi:6-phosphogluconate dehydrogenase
MRINIIGLGRMGSNLALNLIDHGHQVYGYDLVDSVLNDLSKSGVKTTNQLGVLSNRALGERLIFLLLVPFQIVDTVIEQLIPFLKTNDIIIDGGNSNYTASIRRYQNLKSKGFEFIDMGTSGGTQGARYGACLMVGGNVETVKYLEPMFLDISVKNGYTYTGRPGSGHFVKMVHNGIEYGMMQAIGEGLDLLHASPFELDYESITSMWNHGSIIESALIGYINKAFKEDAILSNIDGIVDDSGEGLWMIEEALKYKVSLPVISQSLFARFKSRDDQMFSEKVVAAMRKEFGGHAVHKK